MPLAHQNKLQKPMEIFHIQLTHQKMTVIMRRLDEIAVKLVKWYRFVQRMGQKTYKTH